MVNRIERYRSQNHLEDAGEVVGGLAQMAHTLDVISVVDQDQSVSEVLPNIRFRGVYRRSMVFDDLHKIT